MHNSELSIWFFIGVLLSIYGTLIFGYGLVEWATGLYPAQVQFTCLHAPIWWGGTLLIAGLFYLIKFRPRRAKQ